MAVLLKTIASLLVAALLVAAAAVGIASVVWNRSTDGLRAQLREGEVTGVGVGSPDDPSLPPPVARYLRRALPDGGARIRFAEVVHQGTFQMGEGDGGWRAFRSTQLFGAYPPAFVWDATIRMAPLVGVRVRDA